MSWPTVQLVVPHQHHHHHHHHHGGREGRNIPNGTNIYSLGHETKQQGRRNLQFAKRFLALCGHSYPFVNFWKHYYHNEPVMLPRTLRATSHDNHDMSRLSKKTSGNKSQNMIDHPKAYCSCPKKPAPVEVGSLSCYFQGFFSTIPGGWDFGISSHLTKNRHLDMASSQAHDLDQCILGKPPMDIHIDSMDSFKQCIQ